MISEREWDAMVELLEEARCQGDRPFEEKLSEVIEALVKSGVTPPHAAMVKGGIRGRAHFKNFVELTRAFYGVACSGGQHELHQAQTRLAKANAKVAAAESEKKRAEERAAKALAATQKAGGAPATKKVNPEK